MNESRCPGFDVAIKDLALFRDADYEAITPLVRECPVLELARADILLEPGRPNQWMYLILDGQLEVRLGATTDPVIATLGPGECVGEMSLIDGRETSAYVMAGRPSRVLSVDEARLWLLVNASHAVARNLLRMLTARVRRDNAAILQGRAQQELLKRNATVDALTGLRNRRWLDETCERLVHRAGTDEYELAAIMLDVDHFKQYNDAYGHPAGDRVLRAVAETVSRHLRPHDLAARYGGEEFVVLLPDTGTNAARKVAERLRLAIVQTEVVGADGVRLPAVSASLGVASLECGDTVADFLARADAALYRAKSAGRNRVEG